MAGASLLSLLDDIATLLDDVSVMTKIAARKTAMLMADDVAVNAEQVAGGDEGSWIVGALAMFLVGGGIFSHNIPWFEHLFKGWAALTDPLEPVTRLLLDGLLGVVIGAIVVVIITLGARLTGQGKDSKAEH